MSSHLKTIPILMDALNEQSPRTEQPSGISMQLKPHQLASLYRMCVVDRFCGGESGIVQILCNMAILADLAGYGKTITFLSLVELSKGTEMSWMPHIKSFISGGYGITLTKERKRECVDTTLIVVPDNLINHWQRHIEDYTELTFETVQVDTCKKILIEDYDIILCPARFYNKFVIENREYYWTRVAFDEADSIHIPNTEPVLARFLWMITATYDNIPNRKNKGFLKNIFKSRTAWVDPIKSYFSPVIIKGTNQFVKKSFSLLEPETVYVECATPNFISALRHHVDAHILELMSAGDTDGAIMALGGNVNSDRNIIELVTKTFRNQITIVNAKIETLARLEISEEERNEKRGRLENKLESLTVRNASLEESISTAASSDCAICREILKHPTLVPCCNNMFCAACLLDWMKSNEICPMCRGSFDPAGLYTINNVSNNNTPREPVSPKKDKMSTVVKIIRENPEGRYIIFSGYVATFRDVGATLLHEHIGFGTLTTNQTESTLSKFRDGELSVILLDAKCNGAGIEIPQATDIILYHQMKSIETQAIARAQRPGRVGRLRVWKLKYHHEYSCIR